ncbi:MAG: hypothetical protein IKZ84_07930 [Victivallales bacterium]|nr:hypothetical protein [Victivallales bacterium]
MAISPIDLQTVYTQLEKVSKTQVQATQASQLQSVMNQDSVEKKNNEKKAAVEQTVKYSDENIGKLKDRNGSAQQEQNEKNKKQKQAEKHAYDSSKIVLSDPALGQHIDVSG